MYIFPNNTLSHCLKVEAILHQIKQVYFEHFLLYCWYNIQYYTIINLQLHRFIYILTDMRYFFIVQLPYTFSKATRLRIKAQIWLIKDIEMKYNTISERNQLIILFYDEVMLYNSRALFCHSNCTKTIAHLIFLFSLIFKVIFDILL